MSITDATTGQPIEIDVTYQLRSRNPLSIVTTMNTQLTVALPTGAVHMDDDSDCTAPDVCGRSVYWPGGAPASLTGCAPAEQ